MSDMDRFGAMRLPKFVVVASLAGALLFVAGCDGSTPSADPTPTQPPAAPSTALTASPAPTPPSTAAPSPASFDFDASVPPQRPAGLQGPASESTVADAARYFISLFPYIFATGDLESWESISGEDCEWCADIAQIVRTDVGAGKRREGGRMDFVDVQAFHDAGDRYYAVVRLKEQPSRVLAADSTVVERTDFVQDAKLEVGLRWTGDAWSVFSVGVDLLGTS